MKKQNKILPTCWLQKGSAPVTVVSRHFSASDTISNRIYVYEGIRLKKKYRRP